MRRVVVEFWLALADVFDALNCDRAWLWAVCKASDATYWGSGAHLGDEEPF